MENLLPSVEIETNVPVSFCIIWLHGLGADGHDFETVVPTLSLPEGIGVRFVFPHAPYRPVTINNGAVMRAWYDIYNAPLERTDCAGIYVSAQALERLIEREEGRGIKSHRVILAGFSQGGAIALYTGLCYPRPLAGIMALSTYLPLLKKQELDSCTVSRNMPILMAHGTEDPIVPYPVAINSRNLLQSSGFNIEWHDYPIGHGLCVDEIDHISSWMSRVFQNNQDA